MQQLINTIAQVNGLGLKNKSVGFIKKTKQNQKFLLCLQRIGIVKSIQVKNTIYIVQFKTQVATNRSFMAYTLSILSKTSQKVYSNVYKLQGLAASNRRTIFIIKTSDGDFYTADECATIGCGGLLVANIIV